MARMPWHLFAQPHGGAFSCSDSLHDRSMDDDKDGRSSVAGSESMSMTTASEYSAAY